MTTAHTAIGGIRVAARHVRRLDDELVEAYASTMYGYGTYDARHWLIGIEEGSSGNCEEIAGRLASWDRHGRPELMDVLALHQDIGALSFFGPGAVEPQRTWRRLIMLLFAADGRNVGDYEILRYQADRLGRSDGETCLLERLPLPAKKSDAWPYSEWSQLPQMATRREYERSYTEQRATHLRERLRDHAPRAVIFYGWGVSDLRRCESISAVPFARIPHTGPLPAWYCSNGTTVFASIYHPAYWTKGLTDEYFRQVGRAIRDLSLEAGRSPQ